MSLSISRTAERVLSIIAAILSALGVVGIVLIGSVFRMAMNDPLVYSEMEAEMLRDGTLTAADVEMVFSLFESLMSFVWVILVVAIIGLILNIVGIVQIWNNKNPKLAGTLFIIAGLLAGILSLASILLYIAGIMCFTKKPPLAPEAEYTTQQTTDLERHY